MVAVGEGVAVGVRAVWVGVKVAGNLVAVEVTVGDVLVGDSGRAVGVAGGSNVAGAVAGEAGEGDMEMDRVDGDCRQLPAINSSRHPTPQRYRIIASLPQSGG